jgi:hypothetical protein
MDSGRLTRTEAEALVDSPLVDALRRQPKTEAGHAIAGKMLELSDFGLSDADVIIRLGKKIGERSISSTASESA